MADSPIPPAAPEAPLDPDPEIAALLGFEPVRRHTRRHDGWRPEHQRGFIAALARLGLVDRAAISVGRTEGGAWKVRRSAGADGFSDSWEAALDLFHARNPGIKPHAGRARLVAQRELEPPRRSRRRRDDFGEDVPEFDSEEQELEFKQEVFGRILGKYLRKLEREREARLEGRIVEADFYVRQLTFIEVLMDLGGEAARIVRALERGGRSSVEIVATPMSVFLDTLRRAFWAEEGGPERPDLPPLGEHDDEIALGEPAGYSAGRDGPEREWREARSEKHRLAAAAQQAWEEKARADAAAWARREAASSSPAVAGGEACSLSGGQGSTAGRSLGNHAEHGGGVFPKAVPEDDEEEGRP